MPSEVIPPRLRPLCHRAAEILLAYAETMLNTRAEGQERLQLDRSAWDAIKTARALQGRRHDGSCEERHLIRAAEPVTVAR